VVAPEVYEPADDTYLLADNLDVRPGEKVLELGTGCGLVAILAAKMGARVVATDVNPAATECARLNAEVHKVADKIDFRVGNLLEPVKEEVFDLILFNPPYLPTSPSEVSEAPLDLAWNGGQNGRSVIDEFLREFPAHLTRGGRAIFVQSSLSNIQQTASTLERMNFQVKLVECKKFSFEELSLLRCFKP
jgi:release factor glutamine methyltransferase